MKIRIFTLLLLIPLFTFCEKSGGNGNENGNGGDNGNGQGQVDPVDPDAELPPEIKDGETVLVTNANVENFLTKVTYPERNYTETHIRDDEFAPTSPGKDDFAPKFTIRWEADPSAGAPVCHLWEDDGWSRNFVDSYIDDHYVTISSLRPNANYHYEVKAGEKVLTSGSFRTTGHLHQLRFSALRNVRDLGGWKTKDGSKTVKYRMIYRGGRFQSPELNSRGRGDLIAEGIKAQLDLRGHTSSGTQEYLNIEQSPLYGNVEDFNFLAPCIEEGYVQMLRDDQDKCKQCMQFIMKCVRENKPVYFHCSLGRDRTGTLAMMILGILGVNEGDISKEYELTQFAPNGYSVSSGEKTTMTRRVDYKGAANYIWGFTGENGSFADAMQAYLLSIGITQTEIDEFRSLMLE